MRAPAVFALPLRGSVHPHPQPLPSAAASADAAEAASRADTAAALRTGASPGGGCFPACR